MYKRQTLLITAMVMLIIVGGTMFTSIFQINGGRKLVQGLSLIHISEPTRPY